MEDNKSFYIKIPKKEYFVIILILLGQFILPILIPNNIFIIIWIIICVLYFGYELFVIFMINKFKYSYIKFNNNGIKIVNHFNKIKEYLWDDFNGYLKVNTMIFIRIGKKNIKIHDKHLSNGTIDEIINNIEEIKINIKNKDN